MDQKMDLGRTDTKRTYDDNVGDAVTRGFSFVYFLSGQISALLSISRSVCERIKNVVKTIVTLLLAGLFLVGPFMQERIYSCVPYLVTFLTLLQ